MAKKRSKNRISTVNNRPKIAEKWVVIHKANEVININQTRTFFGISKDTLKNVNKPIVVNYGKKAAKIVNSYEGNNLTLSMENVVNELEDAIKVAKLPLKVVWDFNGVRIVAGLAESR
jgi:hypothetical protein